jgi:Lon protease-like protein
LRVESSRHLARRQARRDALLRWWPMSVDADLMRIPIFPLENVVLFPRMQVPLHIFEPRYRQMTQDALAGDRRIGMVVVRPKHTGEMQHDPPVFAIGCAGTIERTNDLQGGRINIVLAGTSRFAIEREEAPDGERLYRCAHVRELADPYSDQDRPRVIALRGEIHELMRQLLSIVAPSRVEIFDQQPVAKIDDETFVNSMSQSIDFAPPEKQALIESDGVRERYERLADFMRFRLAEVSKGGSAGPDIVQ